MNFVEKLERELIRGVQDVGAAIFRESQRQVPVRSGELKRSGYVRKLPDGVEVGYRAPYAFAVETGDHRYQRARRDALRPGDVARTSIFSKGPMRRPPRIDPRAKPRHYLKGSVDRTLPRWHLIVGARLQRTFGR